MTIYHVETADLTRLMFQIDSSNAVHRDSIRDVAMVHIKDIDDLGKRQIRLNDSLITEIKGRGFDGLRGTGRMDFAIHSAGILHLGDNSLQIQAGKEYFILLFVRIGKHYTRQGYVLMDKEHFDNESMKFETTPSGIHYD